MLNPELRSGAFEQSFHLRPRSDVIRVASRWKGVKLALTRKVIEVAREQHRAGFRKPHQETLMARRVTRCRNQGHRLISEHVIIAVDDDGLTIFQLAVLVRLCRCLRCRIAEHEIALGFLDDPRGAGVVVRVPGVISVRVGHRQVGDVSRPVSDRCQLAPQGFVDFVVLHPAALRAIVDRVVQPGVPQQFSLGMNDEEARIGHIC